LAVAGYTLPRVHYDFTTLPNGLRVLTESMPSLRSVALGCWIDTGTRDENDNEAGVSHFLEHLLFKGSEKLSARDVNETLDAIGAESNAFTSKETTCYWARLLDQDLAVGLDVLSEIIQRPAFRPN
jgi:predicted Zn-dependent peptidase